MKAPWFRRTGLTKEEALHKGGGQADLVCLQCRILVLVPYIQSWDSKFNALASLQTKRQLTCDVEVEGGAVLVPDGATSLSRR